jgi:hypothetical protein
MNDLSSAERDQEVALVVNINKSDRNMNLMLDVPISCSFAQNPPLALLLLNILHVANSNVTESLLIKN